MADVLPSDELIEEPSDFGALQPGTRLGRYELLVPIARGGMARVWAARLHGQRGFQKLVAIKTILPHLAEESEFERMFLDEARIASGVHHPNVCEIYELGEENRTLYLAMEWVSGDSFARVLRASGKTEAIDPRVAARVVADACAGLHAAHELTDDAGRALGVVHRDLSPHNVLLTADGVAKVADFGVAKALGQLHEATSAGQLKGKISYMAPEQVTGGAIDRRSDVFSLGCVLYEATTGVRPFRGDGDHQVMHAVLKGEFAAPSSVLRSYPQELERIVLRALAPQPILRYPTAERMRFALEEFLARGQLVTQSNVAQVVRARIGDQIDRRKERIRKASTVGDTDRPPTWSEPPGGMTPSNKAHDPHRSGVKPTGAHARPLYTTMPLGATASSMPPPLPPTANPLAKTALLGDALAPPTVPAAPPNIGATTAQMQAFSLPSSAPPPGPPQRHATVPPGSGPRASGAHYTNPGTHTGTGSGSGSGSGVTTHPPQPMPFSSAAPAADRDAAGPQRASLPPAGAGQYLLAIAAGVLLAVVIGVGGFFAWRMRSAPPTAVGEAPPATLSSGAAAPAASAQAASPGAPSKEIVFRVVPSEASLSVEGAELPQDARVVARPEMGKTVTVVLHAKGHEDVTVLVDYFTTSPMEIALKPITEAAATPVAADTAAAGAAADEPKPAVKTDSAPVTTTPRPAGDRPKPRPKASAADPGLPANPY